MGRSGAEKCSLVFGIISVIFTVLSIAAFTGLTIYVCTHELEDVDRNTFYTYVLQLSIMLALLLVFFIFAVLLVNGVSKRKCKQVLAYLIFGVLVTVASLAGATSFIALSPWEKTNIIVFGAWLFVTFIHLVIVTIVGVAYRKIRSATRQPKAPVLTLSKKELTQLGVKPAK